MSETPPADGPGNEDINALPPEREQRRYARMILSGDSAVLMSRPGQRRPLNGKS